MIGMRRVLNNQKGFTLIELISVIVVLGLILGIGVPMYAMIQAQSEWDTDVTTLINVERAAEMYYSATKDSDEEITILELHNAGYFDKYTVLKRVKSGTASVRNKEKKTLYDLGVKVIINPETGKVVWADDDPDFINDGTNDWINKVIGLRPPNGTTTP